MKIDSIESIWDNLGFIVHQYNGYKIKNKKPKKVIYNCSPKRMKDGSIKNTFIEVGQIYLFSRVKDDSQGFVMFKCKDRINYDKEHKISFSFGGEHLWNKIIGKHNTSIAQIYNEKTKEYLNKESNIVWKLSEGQALFTTLEEAEEYIKQCENGDVKIPEFFIKIEKVETENKQ